MVCVFIRHTIGLGILALLISGCQTSNDRLENRQISGTRVLDPGTFEIGETALKEGRYDDVQIVLQRIFEVDPNSNRGRLLVAELLLATGRAEAALNEFNKVTIEEKLKSRILEGKGLSMVKLRRMSEGKKLLELAIAEDGSLWKCHNALGYLFDTERSWSKASIHYNKAIELHPKTGYLYNNRGFSNILQGKYDKAINDLNHAIRLEPKNDIAQLNLQLALAWKGEYLEAKLGADERKKAQVLNNIGYIALLKGEFKQAEVYFLRAIEADAAFNKVAHLNLVYLKKLEETRQAK